MKTEAPSIPATTATNSVHALRAMTAEELSALLASAGFQAFRGKQLFHWLQKKGARSFDEMRNLPADLRAWLAENAQLGGIAEVIREKPSADGSVKFLFDLRDGKKVESVLMPGSGQDPTRMTLCVSSQVGCAVDCKFCVTGANGFFRHMTADEIVDQALYARRYLAAEGSDRVLRNIVFMGMGEPLLNTDNVLRAIRLMVEHEGMDLSPKRITVSTSGILPGLQQLADADLGVGLAISLNAPTQAQREEIMPITKRYPLDALMEACRRFPRLDKLRITFEYVLLAGLNDSTAHARKVVSLLHGIPSKVNVIPFNPDPVLPYERPDEATIERFCEVLREAHLTTSVRWSKALDVSGACGQLAGQYRQKAESGYVIVPRD